MKQKNFRSKWLRSTFLIFCTLMLFLHLSGCGNKQQEFKEPVLENISEESEQTKQTVTVVDSIGRQVEVPVNIERIASLCPESGHAMAMFGMGDKIVAATNGMKRDILLTQMYPNILDASKPKTSGVINIEELLNCNPDLVFVKMDTAQSDTEMEKMNKFNLPFLVVNYSDIEGQQYAIEMMGKAVSASEKAKEYNEYFDRCIKLVQPRINKIPKENRVTIYHSVNEAVRTDASGTLAAEWTEIAGAINVSVDKKLKLIEDKHYASLEEILLWNPEIILVSDPDVSDYIMTNEQWAPLRAVKSGKIWTLPNGLTRWGHPTSLETPLAILWTAQKLYPELFTDIDIISETKYFYETFFNYHITDEMAEQILSGEGMRISKN